jgi:hypothetical protein
MKSLDFLASWRPIFGLDQWYDQTFADCFAVIAWAAPRM